MPRSRSLPVAVLDVEGTISFEQFMDCVAMSMGSAEPEPPPPAPLPPAPQPVRGRATNGPMQPLDAAGWAMGKAPPAPAKPSDPAAGLRIHRPDVMAEATADVRGMLGGRKAGAASLVANQGIVDLLNGGSSQHGRKSDIGITVGKSSQFR